jgi:hypothetical protein
VLYLFLISLLSVVSFAKPLYTVDAEYRYANQVREQSYSTNDDNNYGDRPFQSLHMSSIWDLGQSAKAVYLWDAQLQYYDLIQTSIASLGVAQRTSLPGYKRTRYMAIDYTDFDQKTFMQFVLGQHGELFGMPSHTHIALPFGNTQLGPASTLAAMPGIEQMISIRYGHYSVDLSGLYYSRKDVSDSVSAVGMTLVYNFSQFLETGLGYQFYSGFGSDNTSGALFYARVPIVFTPDYRKTRLGQSLDSVRRPLGALVQSLN